jgi:hypothetical protein
MIRMTRQDRQNWAGVAILSVILHALLFAYHAAAPVSLALQGAGLSEAVVICSGGQPQIAWLGKDGERGDPGSSQIIECPVCSAAAAFAMLPDAVGELTATAEPAQPLIAPRYGPLYRSRLGYSHAPRAPPLSG